MSSVGESIWYVFQTCMAGMPWVWVIVGTDMDINSKPRPARHKSIAMSEGRRGEELFYTQKTSLSYVNSKEYSASTVHNEGDVTSDN